MRLGYKGKIEFKIMCNKCLTETGGNVEYIKKPFHEVRPFNPFEQTVWWCPECKSEVYIKK